MQTRKLEVERRRRLNRLSQTFSTSIHPSIHPLASVTAVRLFSLVHRSLAPPTYPITMSPAVPLESREATTRNEEVQTEAGTGSIGDDTADSYGVNRWFTAPFTALWPYAVSACLHLPLPFAKSLKHTHTHTRQSGNLVAFMIYTLTTH